MDLLDANEALDLKDRAEEEALEESRKESERNNMELRNRRNVR